MDLKDFVDILEIFIKWYAQKLRRNAICVYLIFESTADLFFNWNRNFFYDNLRCLTLGTCCGELLVIVMKPVEMAFDESFVMKAMGCMCCKMR